MKAPRKSDKVAEHKEIAISRKALAQYTGTFELRPRFDLVITLEGDQLVSQATGRTRSRDSRSQKRSFSLRS